MSNGLMVLCWMLLEKSKQNNFMKKFQCVVCSYVYDPYEGDPEADIGPGTPFEELPDDYVCPVCGVGKEDFVELDD